MVVPRHRWLGFGLATLFGLAPRGFFIPYRYAGTVAPPGERAPYDAIASLFGSAEADFTARLEGLADYYGPLRAMAQAPSPAPRWDQDWFPRLDAAVAYAMVRQVAPKRIVEVGSGHSTRFLARAVADSGADVYFTAIDPAPRAAIDRLNVEIIRETVQRAGSAPFAALAAGDMLFIDSSHILMPGTDVDYLMNRVMPALPAGVLVHIHDIYTPRDYPDKWVLTYAKLWNEQYLLEAYLCYNNGWRVLGSLNYLWHNHRDALLRACPVLNHQPDTEPTSFWIVRN